MTRVYKIFGLAILTIFYIACKKDFAVKETKTGKLVLQEYLNIPETPFNYAHQKLPVFFSEQFVKIQNNTPAANKVTDWGATLGRVLFYDTRLSKNNTISCASCHAQQFGFTDTAQFSKGFEGGFTQRHSMSLINAAYYTNGRFFWDERAASLESQVLHPIQDPVEMGLSLDTLIPKLQQIPIYPLLFNYAFGDSVVSAVNISKALSQFVRSIISYQSRFDEQLAIVKDRKKNFPGFTPEENEGKSIFMNHPVINCSGCHTTDVLIMDNPRNNGLSLAIPDSGIYVHTRNPMDLGKFKSPTLKSIALRQRFMHDGSLKGLESVLKHYNTKIQGNTNLDPHLVDANGFPLKMNLTAAEIKALESFLHTLTDKALLSDPKFSTPFR